MRPVLVGAMGLVLWAGAGAAEGVGSLVAEVRACFVAATEIDAMRACIGVASARCMEATPDGQSTLGMTDCLRAEAAAWDTLLNAEYRATMAAAEAMDAADLEYFPDLARRVDQIRTAQRAWIVFRDAECAMQGGYWGPGSMRMPIGAACLLEMTAERTIELRAYRDGG